MIDGKMRGTPICIGNRFQLPVLRSPALTARERVGNGLTSLFHFTRSRLFENLINVSTVPQLDIIWLDTADI